jgi:hypothetical protein
MVSQIDPPHPVAAGGAGHPVATAAGPSEPGAIPPLLPPAIPAASSPAASSPAPAGAGPKPPANSADPHNPAIPARHPPKAPAGPAYPAFDGIIEAMYMCMAASGQGQPVQIQPCDRRDAERFHVKPGAADYTIMFGNACLQPADGAGAKGTRVVPAPCNSSVVQTWQWGSDYLVRNKASGRCIDVPTFNNVAGSSLMLWDCNGGDNQNWGFTDW